MPPSLAHTGATFPVGLLPSPPLSPVGPASSSSVASHDPWPRSWWASVLTVPDLSPPCTPGPTALLSLRTRGLTGACIATQHYAPGSALTSNPILLGAPPPPRSDLVLPVPRRPLGSSHWFYLHSPPGHRLQLPKPWLHLGPCCRPLSAGPQQHPPGLHSPCPPSSLKIIAQKPHSLQEPPVSA